MTKNGKTSEITQNHPKLPKNELKKCINTEKNAHKMHKNAQKCINTHKNAHTVHKTSFTRVYKKTLKMYG